MGEPHCENTFGCKKSRNQKKKLKLDLKKSAANQRFAMAELEFYKHLSSNGPRRSRQENDLTLTMPATSVNSRPTGDRRRLIGHCWLKTEHEWR